MTVRILGPAACRPFVMPSAHYGINLIAYNLDARPCEPWQGYQDPKAVAAILERMQQTVPMGWMPEGYVILCPDQKLVVLDDGGQPSPLMAINGERLDGWIVLSADIDRDLADLVSHETTHELAARFFGPAEQAELMALTGWPHEENTSPHWHLRPQEILAEVISTALWGMPFNEVMLATFGAPTPELLSAVKEWALNIIGDWPKAQFAAVDTKRTVTLTISSTTATVNGEPITLDVAPVLKAGRTCVPLRMLTEALGAVVTWNDVSKRVHIDQGGHTVIVEPGSTIAIVDGVYAALDVAPWIEPGANRTMAPLRFIAEALGLNVSWDQTTKTVTITN